MKNQKGQAAILIVFVLCMITIFIGISLLQTGFGESMMGRANPQSAKAFYIANSGVEEAMYKLTKTPTYGSGIYPGDHFDLTINEGQTSVNVYTADPINNPDQRIIESAGKSGLFIRRIKTEIVKSSTLPGFDYAIQSGNGGFLLAKNAYVVGNVYSKATIVGNEKSCPPGASSEITGNVMALGSVEEVCINGDVQAASVVNCNVNGSIVPPPAPTTELPNMNLPTIKNYLNRFPPFPTTCHADGSNTPNSDCTFGTKQLGNKLILGNLYVDSDITFTGPVWVTGSIYFNKASSIINLSPEVITAGMGQIVVSEHKIEVTQNTIFTASGGVFLLLIAAYDPGTIPDICTDPAITITANIDSVLFYATKGCLKIGHPTASKTFTGSAIGEKVSIEKSATINYNSALGSAVFGLTTTGGWTTLSFKEE